MICPTWPNTENPHSTINEPYSRKHNHEYNLIQGALKKKVYYCLNFYERLTPPFSLLQKYIIIFKVVGWNITKWPFKSKKPSLDFIWIAVILFGTTSLVTIFCCRNTKYELCYTVCLINTSSEVLLLFFNIYSTYSF